MRRLLLVLALLIIVAAPAPAANPPGLSSEQRGRLERGEIVVLDTLPPGGAAEGGHGGTAMTVVHADPDDVWNVLIDYPQHLGLYPRVVSVEVLESNSEHAVIRYVVGVGPFSFGFHVENYLDVARHRVVWRLAHGRRNDLFRDSWGYWQIERHPDGVMLTYAMAARTALPRFMTRGSERDGLIDTVKAVRARVEHGR